MKIKDERKVLENLLNVSSEEIGKEPPRPDTAGLNMEPAFTLDFELLQKDCEKRAKKMIHNSTGFMFSDELVKDNPYLKNKMQVDIISLAGMLYQVTVNEAMQKALMEEIRSGALHPRNFEVFSQLSKTIGDLNKQLLQTVEAIKCTYRDLKNDIRERSQDMQAIGQSNMMRNEGGLISLGTKELINETKKLKAAQYDKIEDVEEIK